MKRTRVAIGGVGRVRVRGRFQNTITVAPTTPGAIDVLRLRPDKSAEGMR